ncbi:MAG: 50S ribosomal protein L6 [Anaerolineaceae bacterium]
MSRIGRLPVNVPANVQIKIDGQNIHVKGPKGELAFGISPAVSLSLEEGQIFVSRANDEATNRSLHGTTRALIQNMVTGVSEGFTRVLQVQGVGYRAEMNGKNLVLHVGYSHPVETVPEPGISFDVDPRAGIIKVMGFDKQQVGQVAANIRMIRPVEPYKAKGLFYQGERIRRKAGKAGKK